MSKLLIDEWPLIILPSMAKKIGLHEAIILQQLNYWINHVGPDGRRYGKVVSSERWIRNTVKEWHKRNFIFLSESMIYRAIEKLERLKLIKTRKDLNKIGYDRTKWYTIDYAILHEREMEFAPMRNRTHASEDTIPETTSETTTDIKNILSFWKEYFPNKAQPRPTTKSLQRYVKTRMKDSHFRENWQLAIKTASTSWTLQNKDWFDLYFVVKNDRNYQRCIDNFMKWKDEEDAPKVDEALERRRASANKE